MRTTVLLIGALVAACAPANTNGSASAGSTPDSVVPGSAPAAAAAAAPAAASSAADPDVRPIGANGLPEGYTGRADREDASLSDVKYIASGGVWDVTTGPAHILFSMGDRLSGDYTVSTTIEQLVGPAHREAFGLFFGGTTLLTPEARYTYFLVAGTGEYRVRERNAQGVRGLIAWEKSELVPTADAAGRATYNLAVQVKGDSVRFKVNGVEAAWLSKRDLSIHTDGLVGLRINHNLRLRVSPVRITRP